MNASAPRRTPVMLTALCLLVLGGCSSVSPTPAPPALAGLAAPVVQDTQGLAVVRATAFAGRWPEGQHAWQPQPNALAVGGTELVALNDVNATVDAAVETLSPRLDYPVQFVRAGTHYVWVHGQAAAQRSLNGDSLHVGLNQRSVWSAKRITGFGGAYRWSSRTMGGGVATLQIPAPGLYTLNVWMREDGTRFDGLAVSSDPGFLPTATTLAAAPVAAAPAPTPAPNIKTTPAAFSAQTLRNSVGINLHSTYDDTAYYDVNRIFNYLKELGPAWVREGVHPQPRSWHPGFLRNLKTAGFKVSVTVGDPAGTYGNFGIGDSRNLIASLKTTYAGLFDQIEFPNEWDLFSPTGNWVSELGAFYDEYYGAIKRDAYFNGIRVAGPSFGTSDGPRLFPKAADAANLHPYSGGLMPENDDTTKQFTAAKTRTSTGQMVATELGFHNAVNTSSGFRGVPEDVAAHYLVRTFLWNLSRGVDQSYAYQLFDQKPQNPQRTDMEEWFGLVAVEGNPSLSPTTWTLRKKPAFGAISRLQLYLQDAGSSTAPTVLPFEAVNLPGNAVMLPIARRDGSYDVAIWLKNSLYERNNRTVIPDTSATATLKFGTPVSVSGYRPSVGGVTTQLGTGVSEITVTVDGKVTFFRVRP